MGVNNIAISGSTGTRSGVSPFGVSGRSGSISITGYNADDETHTYSKYFNDYLIMSINYVLISGDPWSSVVEIERHNVVKFFRKYKMDISPSRFINLVKTFNFSFSDMNENMEKLGIFLDMESRNNKLDKILK